MPSRQDLIRSKSSTPPRISALPLAFTTSIANSGSRMIPSSKDGEKRSRCWFPGLSDNLDRADRPKLIENDHAWRSDESATRRDRLLSLLRLDRVNQKAGPAGPIGMGGRGTP